MKHVLVVLMLALATLAPPCRAEEKVVSDTLKRLLALELDDVFATSLKGKTLPDGMTPEKMKAEVAAGFEKYITVTPAEEEKLKKSELDETVNRRRMEAQVSIIESLPVDRPAFTRKYVDEWHANSLKGLRLELALRLNLVYFQGIARALNMPELADPEGKTLSDTLLRELTLYTSEILDFAVKQGVKPPSGVTLDQWRQASVQPFLICLVVTTEQEGAFKRGQFDDDRNTASMKSQAEVFDRAAAASLPIPDFVRKNVDDYKAGKLSRTRLELALRINKQVYEQTKKTLDSRK